LIAVILAACLIIRDRITRRRKIESTRVNQMPWSRPPLGGLFVRVTQITARIEILISDQLRFEIRSKPKCDNL
jgi:hypothetical protein